MKVLGNPNDDVKKLIVKSWTMDISCQTTEEGKGCGSFLRAEANDVTGIQFVQNGLYSNRAFVFKCPCCGNKVFVLTQDIGSKEVYEYMLKKLYKNHKIKGDDPIITGLI